MRNRFAYALAAASISGAILSDLAGYSSLYANLVFLTLAAGLLVYGGVAGNPDISDWNQAGGTHRRSSRGMIWRMAVSVKSAERGSWSAREELARFLAEASSVKRGESLNPDYDTIMRSRQRLMATAEKYQGVRRVFEHHEEDSSTASRFRRRKDETYLSALETAIAMVSGGE